MHLQGHMGPGGCAVGPGKGVSVRPRVFHTTAGGPVTGPRFKATPSQLPLVPRQKRAVKERGSGLAGCSWAMCSSWRGVVGPEDCKSPQLIAVILDDDLHPVVPQLGSEQQVLVFKIFHLTRKGGHGESEQKSRHSRIPERVQTSASGGRKMKPSLWKPEAGVPQGLAGCGVEEG